MVNGRRQQAIYNLESMVNILGAKPDPLTDCGGPKPLMRITYFTIHEHRESSSRHWATHGEHPTLAYFRHFSSLFTNLPSTTVENALQISSFLTNKPNFRKVQMNVSYVIIKVYENKTLGERGKNKANSNPNKANQSQFTKSQNEHK